MLPNTTNMPTIKMHRIMNLRGITGPRRKLQNKKNSGIQLPSETAIRIYISIQSQSQGLNHCQISYNKLAKQSAYCRSTVINAIKELCLHEWLKKHVHCDANLGHRENVYELLNRCHEISA